MAFALLACGGGGGGDRAPGVAPGPTPPGGPVTPPPPILPSDTIDAADLTAADQVQATITGISFNSPPTVTFTLVANGLQKVGGVDSSMLATSIVHLVTDAADGTRDWASLISTTEDPVCRSAADVSDSNNQCTTFTTDIDPALIPDSARKVQDMVATGKMERPQATTEKGGALAENADGSWAYTLLTDPGDPAGLAQMHRICFQFSLAAPTNNSCIDFVPQDLVNDAIGDKATSLDSAFYQSYTSRLIVADDSCNSCHNKLAIHGGGRTATQYCVTCHNPDTTDANSEHSVDLKIMAHRIHAGITLPSVTGDDTAEPPVEPVPYKIWGFRNGEHDYSNIHYPQPVNLCTRCHAGQQDIDYAQANGLPAPEAVITPDGYNWATYGGRKACESCHDDQLEHGDGGAAVCISCHVEGGVASTTIESAHRDRVGENARTLSFDIESVSQTGPGQSPVVVFTVSRNGTPIDIKDTAVFDGKLKIGVAWDGASDFDNEGLSGFDSLNIEIDAIANSTPLGGNRFQLNTAPDTIAPDQDTIGVMLFGHETIDEQVSAIDSVIDFYPSTATTAGTRRVVVDIKRCDSCHHRLSMTDTGHAGFHAAPAENPQLCTGCHGPGLGFSISADYRVLIHAIHASAMRETPWHDYDTDRLQFPGNLADCESCHLPGTYTLPSPVLSVPLKDGAQDQYSSPTASACGACHDNASAKTHMVTTGGGVFNVPQAEAAIAIETCDVCHRSGASADVDVVHSK